MNPKMRRDSGFRKGKSGNPRGRPRATPAERAERHALKRVEQDTYANVMEGVALAQQFAPEMIEKLKTLATCGDADTELKATEQLRELMLWPRDATELRARLPGLASGTATERSAAILAAVADGALSPAGGEALLNLVSVATGSALTEQIMGKVAELRTALAKRGLGHLLPDTGALLPGKPDPA